MCSKNKENNDYFYNSDTKQFKQIENKYRPKYYKSVQNAKKNLYKVLWIKKDIGLTISKEKDIYIVTYDEIVYSPFANMEIYIKKLKVKLKYVKTKPTNNYQSIRIVTGDEYNNLINEKLKNLSNILLFAKT